jgi:hypothetical protein
MVALSARHDPIADATALTVGVPDRRVAELDTRAVEDATDSTGVELGNNRKPTAPSPHSAGCPAVPRRTYSTDH